MYNETAALRILDTQSVPEIFYVEGSGDIFEFLQAIKEFPVPDAKSIAFMQQIFDLIEYPVTVVYEKDYVDKIFRDTFYTHFAGKHKQIERNCKRLAFFRGCIERNVFFSTEGTELLQRQFVGICVIKPLNVGKIGRTLLDPSKLKFPTFYTRTAQFRFVILGHNLCIDAFPFSSQDAETMSCAEVTIWNILEYFGTRYPEYRTVLPSHIINELERISQERTLPSRGLDYYKVSDLLKTFGFAPRLYARKYYSPDEFKHIFHYYVESGIPLAVGVTGKLYEKEVKHSIVCIGHGGTRNELTALKPIEIDGYPFIDTADLYDSYVVMDDNQFPYKVEQFNDFTQYHDSSVSVFVVPLYKRVFLEANDASTIITEILKRHSISFTNFVHRIDEEVGSENPLVIRFYLTSARKFKNFRAMHSQSDAGKFFYGSIHFPRFIWVAEISTYSAYKENKVYGEIILDATSSRSSRMDSLLMIRYLDHIGYRDPREEFQQILDRLQHRATGFTYPYALYENNLKESGGS